MTTPTDPLPNIPPAVPQSSSAEVPPRLAPLFVVPLVKSWHASKTLVTNIAIIVLFVIGGVGNAAGIFHLTPEIVAGLGIATGAINLGLRLSTNSAILGTGAAQAQIVDAH